MKTITINDLQIHSNTDNLGYVAQSIDGLGYPGVRLSKYGKVGESGAIVSNVLYDGRRILISGMIFADNAIVYEQKRRALESALALTKDRYSTPVPIRLKVTTIDDLAVQIDTYIEEFSSKAENPNGMEFLLDLFAPDPRFVSQANLITALSRASGGGAVYPLIYPAVYEANTGGSAVIVNSGSCESYPIVYLNGPLTNPLIQNVTVGRYVQLALTLSAGETITIDMQNKTIVKNGNQSVIANKSNSSKYFWLARGANTIRFSTTDGSDIGNCQVDSRDAYIGL